MIDKSLVKKRFEKSLKTYNDNAFIQKKMADKLIELLPYANYNSILEIGCATGILTEKIAKKLTYRKFTAIDIVENSKEYIKEIIPDNTFISGDIEDVFIPQTYDLIISNATLQWCNNIENTIEKLKKHLNNNGILAFSIFANDNYKEMKQVLNLKNSLETRLTGTKETYKLYFDSPIDVLKHIKATGANALTEFKFTKTSLKEFCDKYKTLFNENNKVFLTYKPIYIVIKK